MNWLTEKVIGLILVAVGIGSLAFGLKVGVLVVLVGLWMTAFGDNW